MAQTRVFSWKIDDNKFGYLYVSENKTGEDLICDRIVDNEKLTEISSVVSSWSDSEYERRFNILDEAISAKYGKRIPGGYSRYINGYADNYIILTGADGKNSTPYSSKADVDEIIEKVRKTVKDELSNAKSELLSDVKDVKDYTIGKFSASVVSVRNEFLTYKSSIESSNAELKTKINNATSAINAASSLFDLNGGEVNKEALKTAITNASTAVNSISLLSDKFNNQQSLIGLVDSKIDWLKNEVSGITDSIYKRIDNAESKVMSLNDKVDTIKSKNAIVNNDTEGNDDENDSYSDNSKDYEILGAFLNQDNITSIDTIDNGDDTYTVSSSLNGEPYSIKFYGPTKRLNSRNKETGLSIASNGFRYIDENGSTVSIINGKILLSNKDGSGKIEIKDDGIYINGNKQ